MQTGHVIKDVQVKMQLNPEIKLRNDCKDQLKCETDNIKLASSAKSEIKKEVSIAIHYWGRFLFIVLTVVRFSRCT